MGHEKANQRALARAVLCIAAVAVALGLTAAPALASEGHVFSTSFAGEGEHALKSPQGVAINQTTGNVYVVDKTNNRVEEFSEGGTFIKAFGSLGTGNGQFEKATQIAVSNAGPTKGDVYVIDGKAKAERVQIFNEAGEYQSQVTQKQLEELISTPPISFLISGVTVDHSGNLWILYSAGLSNVAELPPGGPLAFIFESSSGISPGGFGVNAAGEFWVGSGSGAIHYSPTGENLAFVGGGEQGETTGLAVEGPNEDLYIDRGTAIAHFPAPASSSVQANDSFGNSGANALVKGAGMAINQATGTIYVADTSKNRVDVFTPMTLPTVALEAASGIERTSATLNAKVDPEGLEVSPCTFEYVAPPLNEVQTLTPSGAEGGTFTLSFKGQTTAPIPYEKEGERAGPVQEALESLSTIGHGNVGVERNTSGGAYSVTFFGAFAHTNVPQLTVDSSGLSPAGATLTPSTPTQGQPGSGSHATAPCSPPPGLERLADRGIGGARRAGAADALRIQAPRDQRQRHRHRRPDEDFHDAGTALRAHRRKGRLG
jgi:DNA-binding beta-propeller fold protein YncE